MGRKAGVALNLTSQRTPPGLDDVSQNIDFAVGL